MKIGKTFETNIHIEITVIQCGDGEDTDDQTEEKYAIVMADGIPCGTIALMYDDSATLAKNLKEAMNSTADCIYAEMQTELFPENEEKP